VSTFGTPTARILRIDVLNADAFRIGLVLHERRDVTTRWEENLENRRFFKHALALYSDVEASRDHMIDVADHAIR
jgi:hypothetical protein